MEDFRQQRESVLAELAEHKATIQQMEVDQKLALQDIERKNLAERQHIKTTMYNRMLATKEEIIREMVNGVDDTVRRTMAENEHMTTELAYQSRRAEEVIQANKELESTCSKLRGENSMLEQQVQELVKRARLLQRMLHDKADSPTKAVPAHRTGLASRDDIQSSHEGHQQDVQAGAATADLMLAPGPDPYGAAAPETPAACSEASRNHEPSSRSKTRKTSQAKPGARATMPARKSKVVPEALVEANKILRKRLGDAQARSASLERELHELRKQHTRRLGHDDEVSQFLRRGAAEALAAAEQLILSEGRQTGKNSSSTDAERDKTALVMLAHKLQVFQEKEDARRAALAGGGSQPTTPASKQRRRRPEPSPLPKLQGSITGHGPGLIASLSSISMASLGVGVSLQSAADPPPGT